MTNILILTIYASNEMLLELQELRSLSLHDVYMFSRGFLPIFPSERKAAHKQLH